MHKMDLCCSSISSSTRQNLLFEKLRLFLPNGHNTIHNNLINSHLIQIRVFLFNSLLLDILFINQIIQLLNFINNCSTENIGNFFLKKFNIFFKNLQRLFLSLTLSNTYINLTTTKQILRWRWDIRMRFTPIFMRWVFSKVFIV